MLRTETFVREDENPRCPVQYSHRLRLRLGLNRRELSCAATRDFEVER